MDAFIAQAANEFADHYIEGEKKRWARGDACALVEHQPQGLLHLKEQLEQQHGIVVTPQTLRNYAQVAKSFAEEHRHYQYKWSNYLEWSKWENPIEAMELALDKPYSPSQMRNLRLHGDAEHKKDKVCEGCGKSAEKGIVVCRKCQVNARRVAGGVNPLKYAWGDSG